MVTPMSAIDNYLRQATNILKTEITMALAKLGEECVAKARDRSAEESWIDQTGNLRSSIGYAVYDHAVKQVESAFNVVMKGKQGPSEGRKMIDEAARQYSDVFALVVVAGMNYAEWVEAKKNKDVLESTRIWAEKVCIERLNKAKEVAIRKINQLTT